MGPADLTDSELHCFLALCHLVVVADGRFADEEKAELSAICYDVGPERFLTFHVLVQDEDRDLAGALELAATVERPEARAMMQTMLYDLAGTDGQHETEAVILEQLAAAWS